jgi:hypothetical protein
MITSKVRLAFVICFWRLVITIIVRERVRGCLKAKERAADQPTRDVAGSPVVAGVAFRSRVAELVRWTCALRMRMSATIWIMLAMLCWGCASRRPAPIPSITHLDRPVPCYPNARSWVEAHCPSSATPEDQRLFIVFDGRPRFEARIVGYHQGITTAEILAHTSFPRPAYDIRVYRKWFEHGGQRWKPDSLYGQEYLFRPLDLLWIRDREYGDGIEIHL